MAENPTLAVLGAGSWGTALAALTARNGVPTRLWGRDAEALAAMARSRCNQRYLPGHRAARRSWATRATWLPPCAVPTSC